MQRLPILSAKEIIKLLSKAGFKVLRQRGSHIRLSHSDGRVVTVADHKGEDISRGLLKKILRDAKITDEDFVDLLKG